MTPAGDTCCYTEQEEDGGGQTKTPELTTEGQRVPAFFLAKEYIFLALE
jgi:hypothetical protein